MKNKYVALIGLVALSLLVVTSIAMASSGSSKSAATLVDTVRQVTAQFKDVKKATGYALLHGCVSGPQEGAMGIHFANGELVGDGKLDATTPEALLYEPKDGKLQLVGVEYIVIAADWDAQHKTPPVLMGQLFNYSGAPNRFGIPAFYELHVWAWKNNPAGMFADWNQRVSCEEFVGDPTMTGMQH
ncbi:MAG: hypothetical protein ABIV47_20095 [Roseiflexaceae bacterium]